MAGFAARCIAICNKPRVPLPSLGSSLLILLLHPGWHAA